MSKVETQTADVVVVGGGLAGLAAATLVARAGRSVVLFEKARSLGGRAASQATGEFRLNLGPHALYRAGEAVNVLRELEVGFTGGLPSASGAYAVDAGTKHTLPGGLVSLLTTGLLRLPAKLEAGRLLAMLPRIDLDPIHRVSVSEWLERTVRQADVRRLLRALFRLSTYTNDPDRQSAGAAVGQLQLALKSNVTYLDGGWQTLVDGLRQRAERAGVRLVEGVRVDAVLHDHAVRGVRLADGTTHSAGAVIVAGGPGEARALLQGAAEATLRAWETAAVPVRAACLDLALQRAPRPKARFALGIDRPLYLSVHSAAAKLAPAGGALIHVAKYLPPEPTDAKSDERELEGLMDLVQPGWRELIVERRFLPRMIVTHAVVTAATGGLAGRPGPVVPGVAQLYVAGDWVGTAGTLADASLASAKRAAELVRQNAGAHAAAA